MSKEIDTHIMKQDEPLCEQFLQFIWHQTLGLVPQRHISIFHNAYSPQFVEEIFTSKC